MADDDTHLQFLEEINADADEDWGPWSRDAHLELVSRFHNLVSDEQHDFPGLVKSIAEQMNRPIKQIERYAGLHRLSIEGLDCITGGKNPMDMIRGASAAAAAAAGVRWTEEDTLKLKASAQRNTISGKIHWRAVEEELHPRTVSQCKARRAWLKSKNQWN